MTFQLPSLPRGNAARRALQLALGAAACAILIFDAGLWLRLLWQRSQALAAV